VFFFLHTTSFNIQNLTFYLHYLLMRFVSGTEQTAIIPMYNINCDSERMFTARYDLNF